MVSSRTDRTDWLRGVALSLGTTASVFGALVLTAWAAHLIFLIQLAPGMAPHTRAAALSEMLLGLAIVFLATGHNRVAAVCASIVLILAVLVVFEYLSNRSLGVDELLGKDYVTARGTPPGRMSPSTTVCYLSASLALLSLAAARWVRYAAGIAGVIASILIAVGSVMVFAHLIGQASTYRWGQRRVMSIQAAVVLTLLGGAISALAFEAGRMRKSVALWLPLALGLGLSAAALGVWQALMLHEKSQLPLLSHIILVGGIIGASLIAIAVSQMQKARLQSRQLQERKEAYQSLFEASPDALLVTDAAGRIIAANQRATDIFGFTRQELLSQSMDGLVPAGQLTQERLNRNLYSDPANPPGAAGLDLHARRKSGIEIPVEISTSTFRSGAETRVLAAVRDITERKRLEAEIETSRQQAITSSRLSALGVMAGGVAHEINNPLSIIHAMASDLEEMVAEQGLAPPDVVARKSRVIRETAERIARIVRSLRQISREGATDPVRPVPLSRIVTETLEVCRAKFKAHGVELILPRLVPEVNVSCREVQIAQALLNLLQNAFDAVVEKEGERWVQLAIEPGLDSVALSIIDSGPGIPLEIQSRVMEPFFTTKPVGKGTGLGLSLSKTIAEDHGGSLEYGEDRGHTQFSLVLPLARKAEAA